MKKKKEFVVPKVLQVCEVMLEEDLLTNSNLEVSSIQSIGHETEDVNDYVGASWD